MWRRDDGNVGGRASILGSLPSIHFFFFFFFFLPPLLPLELQLDPMSLAICPFPGVPRSTSDVLSLHLSFPPICGDVSSYSPERHPWQHEHTTATRGFRPCLRSRPPSPPIQPPRPAPFLHFYIFEMMDNDVVALFSLLRQTRSHIDCSFSQKAVV